MNNEHHKNGHLNNNVLFCGTIWKTILVCLRVMQ